jgi:S-DNA-T family DNA segregation ATPase FtsK/SpoIIIE
VARRKRSQNRRHAAGAIALVGGLLLGLSFLPEATGLPVVLGRIQHALLGDVAWLIPASAVVGGFALLRATERSHLGRRTVGATLVILAGVTTYHTRIFHPNMIVDLGGRGGGVIGGSILWGLSQVFGNTGLWLVLMLIALTGALLWTRISPATVIEGVFAAVLWLAQAASRIVAVGWQMLAAAATAIAGAVGAVVALLVNALTAAGHHVSGWLHPAPQPLEVSPPRPMETRTPTSVPIVTPATPAQPPAPAAGASAARTSGTRIERPPQRETVRAGAAFQQEALALEAPSGGYQLPPSTLLTDLPTGRAKGKWDPAEVAKALEQTLASFGVDAKVTRWEQGPVVTRFEAQPAPGVRVQRISSLTNDLALALAAPSIRIEAPIPGKSAVGIEVPNQKTSLVHIKEILSTEDYQRAEGPLVVALGKDIAGHPILGDLAEMPHLLIAGATGSGKSVMLNAIIAGLLFRCTPLDVRLLMIDPKRVEFANYNNIPHLLAPVVTNPRAAAGALREMLKEMEERFERFAATGTRNIQSYNQLTDVERLPYLVIIVDELADLMMVAPADFEDVICRLAQMTRATGIHMVVATQRPSVDVITGLIKANIPSRLAFAVSSQVDSRTILDSPGAEKLLGKGDMLYLPMGSARPVRAQGAFIADSEIHALVAWWKAQGRPVFDQDLLHAEQSGAEASGGEDALLTEAARLIVRAGYGSVSLLQRKMKIGYVRAARIVDQLEEKGVVGPAQGSNPRDVLVGLDELDHLLRPSSAAASS